MPNIIQSFYDPREGTKVLFDDDLAVEIPDTLDLEEVLDGAGWLSRTGVHPADLGIQVTVFAGRTHPQFAHNVYPPTEAENLWAWLATIGAVGNHGLDTDQILAQMVESIDFAAPANEVA